MVGCLLAVFMINLHNSDCQICSLTLTIFMTYPKFLLKICSRLNFVSFRHSCKNDLFNCSGHRDGGNFTSIVSVAQGEITKIKNVHNPFNS